MYKTLLSKGFSIGLSSNLKSLNISYIPSIFTKKILISLEDVNGSKENCLNETFTGLIPSKNKFINILRKKSYNKLNRLMFHHNFCSSSYNCHHLIYQFDKIY